LAAIVKIPYQNDTIQGLALSPSCAPEIVGVNEKAGNEK